LHETAGVELVSTGGNVLAIDQLAIEGTRVVEPRDRRCCDPWLVVATPALATGATSNEIANAASPLLIAVLHLFTTRILARA
jgi:hypothetical protein